MLRPVNLSSLYCGESTGLNDSADIRSKTVVLCGGDRERVGEWRDWPLYPKLHGQLAREAATFLLQNQNQPLLLSQEKPWKRETETYGEREREREGITSILVGDDVELQLLTCNATKFIYDRSLTLGLGDVRVLSDLHFHWNYSPNHLLNVRAKLLIWPQSWWIRIC